VSLTLEKPRADQGRVTAGIPSLSSARRTSITEAQLRHIYQRSLQADYRGREEKALEPDGTIQDTTDWEQIVGIPLTGVRIMARLKKLNPNLWFERANADSSKTGVYVLKPDGKGGMEKQFICGMESELSPEFTLRVTDNDGKPKGIIGGWRRLLMRLIRERLITESRAWALFGPPSRDSENWARFTA
jgi:hypothetical protein